MATLTVVGADVVAAEMVAAAATIPARAQHTALEAAHAIEQEWETGAPVGPSGTTTSDPVNVVELFEAAGVVGAVAANDHFVSAFLQRGTVHMAPRYDFYGAAEPHTQRWADDLADVAGDL